MSHPSPTQPAQNSSMTPHFLSSCLHMPSPPSQIQGAVWADSALPAVYLFPTCPSAPAQVYLVSYATRTFLLSLCIYLLSINHLSDGDLLYSLGWPPACCLLAFWDDSTCHHTSFSSPLVPARKIFPGGAKLQLGCYQDFPLFCSPFSMILGPSSSWCKDQLSWANALYCTMRVSLHLCPVAAIFKGLSSLPEIVAQCVRGHHATKWP